MFGLKLKYINLKCWGHANVEENQNNTCKFNPHVEGIDLLLQIDSHYVQQPPGSRSSNFEGATKTCCKFTPLFNRKHTTKNGWFFPRGMCTDLNKYVLHRFLYPFCQLPFPVFLVLIWLFDCKCCFILGHCWGKLWRVSTLTDVNLERPNRRYDISTKNMFQICISFVLLHVLTVLSAKVSLFPAFFIVAQNAGEHDPGVL